MPCCGRRVFTTSPVRWVPISTRTSSTSCATAHAPFISPSMSMPTTAANKPRRAGSALGYKASTPAAFSCPQGHDPNSFSSRVVTRNSSSLSWRPLSHEVPRDLPARPQPPPTARFGWSSKPPAAEVGWINRYLDREYVRRLANTSLRIYAHNLLHFVRWWESVHHTGDIAVADLTESTLLDYLRFQSSLQPRPTAATINQRLADADRALRNAVSGCSQPSRSWVSTDFSAAQADGPWPSTRGDQQAACEAAQAQHRASLSR